jgi:hypothetical protein
MTNIYRRIYGAHKVGSSFHAEFVVLDADVPRDPLALRVDKNVADEYNNKYIQKRVENYVHVVHVNSRCISHTKGRD